jgi:hypothetical protein
MGYLLDPKEERMAETLLEETTDHDPAVPECELAECTCPDFCERDHDRD